MNKKQQIIYDILNEVIDCCIVETDGECQLTADKVLGADRKSNVVMTRCIFVTQMLFMGFSRTTTACILHRSEKAVGEILKQAHKFRMTSFAYRQAEAQATIKMKEILKKDL